MSIRAIYKNGVFQPLEEVPVKEGTEVDVYPRTEGKEKPKKPKSIRDLGFFGMWKNREDIGTGLEYVGRIRKYRDEPERK
jgi:predicted DNA-binding antitoxin AbrB/MazE fold protein